MVICESREHTWTPRELDQVLYVIGPNMAWDVYVCAYTCRCPEPYVPPEYTKLLYKIHAFVSRQEGAQAQKIKIQEQKNYISHSKSSTSLSSPSASSITVVLFIMEERSSSFSPRGTLLKLLGVLETSI